MSDYVLYLDETGSQKPSLKDNSPVFASGGILVKSGDVPAILGHVSAFKERWRIAWPLHGSEIRSQKRKFAWLGRLDNEKKQAFFEDLTQLILTCPVLVHACVVNRQGYHRRYYGIYGDNTWGMMKSSFSIVVERAAKYVYGKSGALKVVFEGIGAHENRVIKDFYYDLRDRGHPFDPKRASAYAPLPNDELAEVLRHGIEVGIKDDPLLQLADLCLYPVAYHKERPVDRAYQALVDGGLLIDTQLAAEARATEGIKYYCYDS